MLTETDLVLPGNAGLDLAVRRFYNSGIYPDYNDYSDPSRRRWLEEDSWAGIGWRLHFGRVLNLDSTEPGATQIEMSDGSRHGLYSTFAGDWITRDLWRYDRNTHTLRLPNGLVYTFGHEVYLNYRLKTVRYVTEIKDVFNNRLTFGYFSHPGPLDGVAWAHQYLGNVAGQSQERHVTFTYDPALNSLKTMQYLDRIWTYEHETDASQAPWMNVLRSVQPPLGRPTLYEYTQAELTKVTAPTGGTMSYTYNDAIRFAGSASMTTRVVTQRTSGWSDVVPSATWTFTYSTGANRDTTVVDCPCGKTTYRFLGTGLSGDFSAWSAGALAEQTVEQGTQVLERQTFTWVRSIELSPDDASAPEGMWADDNIYAPLLQEHRTTRGTQSWTTTHEYHTGSFNDYGRPYRTVETGDVTRTTTRTFQGIQVWNFAPQVDTEQVQVGSQSFTSSVTYDLSTGFVTGRTGLGPPMTFERTAQGNVSASIDGRGNRTTYSYGWGVVSRIDTPNTSSWFDINEDGTTHRAHTGTAASHLTTTYSYDKGRLQSAQPAGDTNWTMYSYDDVYGRWMRVSRGASQTQYDFDGFGRVFTTSNQVNLKTRRAFDACGRVIAESVPYTVVMTPDGGGGNGSVGFQYDALGRQTQIRNPAQKITTIAYDGIDVTQTDALGRQTVFNYSASGSPAQAQLMSVRDATHVVTSYTYDVTGQLAGATLPGGAAPVRTWNYGWAGHLISETQPESGTTQYVYDPSGNLSHTTDSLGQQVWRLYDADNRPHLIDYDATTEDITLTYDAFGRPATQSSPGTLLTWNYDTAGRLEYRTDVVGGHTFQSRYTYDLNDNVDTITYPSGRVVKYEYDSEGRLAAVKQNNAVFADLFAYDDAGRLKSYRTGGVTQTIDYDAAQRVQRMKTGSLLDLTYGYDDVGNVLSITDPRPGASQSFTPDALNRLTAASGPWGQLSWGYDGAGNRLWERSPAQTTYTYDTASQRLLSTSGAGADTFVYDNLGRLTLDGRGTYSYKRAGSLAGVTGAGVIASYDYDAAGLRLKRTINGQTSYTVRSAGGDILSEYGVPCGGAMVWTKDTIYAAGRPLGAVKATVVRPSIELESGAVTVNENQSTVTLSARLTTPSGQPLACAATMAYETKSATAREGADFVRKSGVIAFDAGSVSGATSTITVTLTPDALNEATETFQVALSIVSGGVLGATNVAEVTVLDDDPLPTLTVSDVIVKEGQSGTSNAVFAVTLSAVSGRAISVQYATTANTAVSPSDYTSAAGTLTIPEGAHNAIVSVTINGDTTREATERFAMMLTSPTNSVIADGTGVGSIVNDDSAGAVLHDFDGDREADVVVFRPDLAGTGWLLKYSSGAENAVVQWGVPGDIAASADYDGDAKADVAVYRPSHGVWFVRFNDGTYTSVPWGVSEDVPVPADYDGDSKADIAVYRPSTASWYIRLAAGGTVSRQWGSWGDIPIPGDFDGDGKADIAVYRPSAGVWFVWQSTTDSANSVTFGGAAGDVPVPADYDGDGITDVAVYKPNEPGGSVWHVRHSSSGTVVTMQWGTPVDLLIPADFDGDGTTDFAVFRPWNAGWFVWLPSSESGMGAYWGHATDVPAPLRPRNPNY